MNLIFAPLVNFLGGFSQNVFVTLRLRTKFSISVSSNLLNTYEIPLKSLLRIKLFDYSCDFCIHQLCKDSVKCIRLFDIWHNI